jgi:hypothetical protein
VLRFDKSQPKDRLKHLYSQLEVPEWSDTLERVDRIKQVRDAITHSDPEREVSDRDLTDLFIVTIAIPTDIIFTAAEKYPDTFSVN